MNASPEYLNADGSCFIIAEIGTAHGGSLSKARDLVGAAADSGADCAKFQIVFADEIIHPLTGTVPLPGGDIPLYERFRALEKDEAFFMELKRCTEEAGMRFLCTPFGIRSARILKALGVDMMKIASPELNYVQLLEELAGYGLPLLISSGVSLLEDIEKALAITGTEKTVLLHCITSYPAPEDEYNLKLLSTLSAVFGVPTGLSDHSRDPVLVPVLAVLEGAVVVEKHFTLSRDDAGLDDPIALPPGEFERMVLEVRKAERREREETTGLLRETYGSERVNAVLGTGIKRLAPSELLNYGRTNRSIHAADRIEAGTVLRAEHLSILRTEKILRPGLHPSWLRSVIGKKTVRDIPAGEGLVWDDLLSGD